MLRPFFRPAAASGEWELDLESNLFPGSVPGKTQELNAETRPHLRLGKTMTSVPKIQPGDQVYCMDFGLFSLHFLTPVHIRRVFVRTGHCDIVHSVERLHGVQEDSPVFIEVSCHLCDAGFMISTSLHIKMVTPTVELYYFCCTSPCHVTTSVQHAPTGRRVSGQLP